MDLQLYCAAAAITFFAEIPDKTAFTSFILSTQRKPWAVFAGGAVAMAIHAGIAVALGTLLALLPPEPVRILCGCVFLFFAGVLWVRKEEDDEAAQARKKPKGFFGVALTAFSIIFVAEWGDLTQFSTAALAAKHHSPWTIFFAAVTGLWAAIGLAGWLGGKAGLAFRQRTLQRVAAGVFLALGLWTLLG